MRDEDDDRELRSMAASLLEIRDEVLRAGARYAADRSRRNLLHYLALRRHDMRPLQLRLARIGLSSLGHCEAHVLASLDSVLRMLGRATGERPLLDGADGAPTFDEGNDLLRSRANALFGPPLDHRETRIMVTLSSKSAEDGTIEGLLSAGVDAVRINCGHDDSRVWLAMIERVRAMARERGRSCAIHVDLAGPKIRTCGIPVPMLLTEGSALLLAPDAAVHPDFPGMARAECTMPGVIEALRPSHPVWFDDGKLGGIVDRQTAGGALIRITHARDGGRRLSNDQGINVPESVLDVSGFTAKDREDLDQIAPFADTVALSFAQRPEDVRALEERLARLGRAATGVVLKIETRRGFESLPRLLLEHSGAGPLGVMIARGDLAIEIGYERLAEVQEEILWLCEAAHVPVIWATQVLETLSKDGMPTRAEVTDAAMSGRAECVMLNKGKHVVATVRILDGILRRMEAHQRKKSATLRALRVSAWAGHP
jgi:pyruvate kinase